MDLKSWLRLGIKILTLSSMLYHLSWADVVGVRYDDYALVWDKVPSIEEQYEALLDLFAVLMAKDRDLYADLRWDRTVSSQIPPYLLFSRIGKVLTEADYRLKEKVRFILSDLGDKEVLDFWEAVISEKEVLPGSIRIKVEFGPGEVFVLADGILIKKSELQVLVGSENEELNRILANRLEEFVNDSEEFSRLRALSKIVLLGQKLRELAVLKGRKIKFASFFGKYKTLGLKGNDTDVLRLVKGYLAFKDQPIRIRLRGYDVTISGTVDFSGILPQIEEKEVDITVKEAIEKLGMFGIGRSGKIKPSSLNTEEIISDWQREVDIEPFWKILTILRRTRSQNLVSCAFGFPTSRRIKLGDDILARYFVAEAKEILSDLGDYPDFLFALPKNQSIKILARFDPESVSRSDLAEKLYGFVKLGYLVFIPGMEKGWVVGMKVNEASRLFFASLLSDNKAYLTYVAPRFREEFQRAVKEVKADYIDPFEQEVKLLELVSTYHDVLDRRVQDPWPFVRLSIRQMAGIDPFSGLAISLEGN